MHLDQNNIELCLVKMSVIPSSSASIAKIPLCKPVSAESMSTVPLPPTPFSEIYSKQPEEQQFENQNHGSQTNFAIPSSSTLIINGGDVKAAQHPHRQYPHQNQQTYAVAANALQSQFKIKQQLKQQQQQIQLSYLGLEQEHKMSPLLAEIPSQMQVRSIGKPPKSYAQKSANKSQSSLVSDSLSMSISRSNLANGSMSSIRSEQQLCQLYNSQQHSDYIISDYMEKIATRISLLETELKFAWRALDLLSNEYGKIWTRLEKLENISVEQQSVVGNLMGLIAAAKQHQQQTDLNLDSEMDIKSPFDTFLSDNQVLPIQLDMEPSIDVGNLKPELHKPDFRQVLSDLNGEDADNELNCLNLVMKGHDGYSHIYKGELFADDPELRLSLSHGNDNDEIFLSYDNAVNSPEQFTGDQQLSLDDRTELCPWLSYACESTVDVNQKSPRKKLYSNSDLMMYEQQQIMANNARVELLKEFINGQRVLEQVAFVSASASANTSDDLRILAQEIDQSQQTCEKLSIPSSDTKASTNLTELDELIDEVKFFRLAAVKSGQGGNEVVPIEDTGGTKIKQFPESESAQDCEMNENFYKTLNEAYRENNLTSEISNMERLLNFGIKLFKIKFFN